MSSEQINVLTYNVHLFGSVAQAITKKLGNTKTIYFEDEARVAAIGQYILDGNYDVVVLQELWDPGLAESLAQQLKGTYPNRRISNFGLLEFLGDLSADQINRIDWQNPDPNMIASFFRQEDIGKYIPLWGIPETIADFFADKKSDVIGKDVADMIKAYTDPNAQWNEAIKLVGSGLAIFAKNNISFHDTNFTPYPGLVDDDRWADKGFIQVRCAYDGGQNFGLLTTHMQTGEQSNAALKQTEYVSVADVIAKLRSGSHKHNPVILAGDFNTTAEDDNGVATQGTKTQ